MLNLTMPHIVHITFVYTSLLIFNMRYHVCFVSSLQTMVLAVMKQRRHEENSIETDDLYLGLIDDSYIITLEY